MADFRYEQLEALAVDATSLPQFMAALGHENWRIRRLAADKLSKAEASPHFIASLIFMLGQQGEPGIRNAAASVLGQMGDAALDPLVSLLRHADPGQRKFAADILGELRKPEGSYPLIRALDDSDSNVQGAAAEALSRIGGPEALRALETLLESSDVLLRVCALEGLAALRVPPALPRLKKNLEDPLTRKSAHRVLGLIAHPTAWALIVHSLRNRKSRDAALIAMSMRTSRLPPDLEPDVATALRQMPDAREWLGDALVGSDASRRMGALQIVPAFGDGALAVHVTVAAANQGAASLALEVLLRLGIAGVRALLAGQPPALLHVPLDARAVAAEAIVQLATPVMVEPLVALLHSGDDELADLAARALGRTGSVTAIAPLVSLFADDSLAVHARRSLALLAQSWPQEVKAQLEPVLTASLQPHAVRAWGSIASSSNSDMLQRALRNEKDSVRAAAAESIAPQTHDAVTLVGAALADESPRVRRAATRALGTQIYSAEAALILARAFDDQDASVLAAACTAAAELGAADSLPRLIALASHFEVNVVLSALEALATLGGLTDEIITAAATHRDPEVVKQAFTLGADRQVIIERAHAALRHERWDVRVAAARALAVGAPRTALVALHEAVELENDSLARDLMVSAAAALAAR